MEKEKHIHGFRIFKGILGAIFTILLRPTYKNKEVIPKEGPIIVCGNHIHLLDQCLPILSTKRMLHYMAKKEYFDGPFAWFFKAAGCISVDREHHGGTSKEIAVSVLNKGWALGIYPEGTRNSLACKDEKLIESYELVKDKISFKKYKKLMKKNMTLLSQYEFLKKLVADERITSSDASVAILDLDNYLINMLNDDKISYEEYRDNLLLPIKFGTVSIAQKTGSTIVPYAISGKYHILKNNLTVEFGTPFKVEENDNLEEANEKLSSSIKDLILKSKGLLKWL